MLSLSATSLLVFFFGYLCVFDVCPPLLGRVPVASLFVSGYIRLHMDTEIDIFIDIHVV